MNIRMGQSRSPELSEVLQAAMAAAVDGLFVALPGKIVLYNAATQTASVKPLLKRAVVDNEGRETEDILPILPEVPVCFPRGGGFFVSFPMKPNDSVLLLFMDRSIDTWWNTSGDIDVDPVDLRQHDLSDAIAIPTCYPLPKVIKGDLTKDAIIGKELGAQIHIKEAGTVEVTTKGAPASVTGFVAMATLVATELAKIATLFNVTTGHIHTDSLGSPTTTPLTAYVPGATDSKNLKAD